MQIRRARREDVAALVALYADDFLGAGREHPRRLGGYLAAFEVIDADANHELMVAEDEGGAVVGTFQLTFITHLSHGGSKVAEIEAVRVAAAVRGRGVGAEMMRWAIGRAREAGCRRVQLTSHGQRVDAHRFYERLGFVASHVGMKLELG
ncbi:MAG: GCN5-related N-acetyltransferase [Myxococcales bacterium]|nr:GCN5-related N-acetyltransferase [Myxococcales bacterium]